MGLIAGLSMAAILLFARFWRSSAKGGWQNDPDTAAPMPFHT